MGGRDARIALDSALALAHRGTENAGQEGSDSDDPGIPESAGREPGLAPVLGMMDRAARH
jgi:hypothetical protein